MNIILWTGIDLVGWFVSSTFSLAATWFLNHFLLVMAYCCAFVGLFAIARRIYNILTAFILRSDDRRIKPRDPAINSWYRRMLSDAAMTIDATVVKSFLLFLGTYAVWLVGNIFNLAYSFDYEEYDGNMKIWDSACSATFDTTDTKCVTAFHWKTNNLGPWVEALRFGIANLGFCGSVNCVDVFTHAAPHVRAIVFYPLFVVCIMGALSVFVINYLTVSKKRDEFEYNGGSTVDMFTPIAKGASEALGRNIWLTKWQPELEEEIVPPARKTTTRNKIVQFEVEDGEDANEIADQILTAHSSKKNQ